MAQSGQTQNSAPAIPPRFNSPMEDPSTPYYLHPSEGPGLQLVSHQLRSDNYASWSRAIIIALTIKNKMGFIDGSLPVPPATDPIQLNAWIRNSTMVFSWILNSVSKEIQSSVLYFTSAKEIWDELKTRFQQSNGPHLFQLRRNLANLAQNDQTIVDNYTRVKSLSDELSTFRPGCTCGNLSTYFETECVMNFLMGLNESFNVTRSQILLMDPLPSIARVFFLLVQEENQRSLSISINNNNLLTMATRTEVNKKIGNTVYKKRERPLCTHCGLNGHTIEIVIRSMVILLDTRLNQEISSHILSIW